MDKHETTAEQLTFDFSYDIELPENNVGKIPEEVKPERISFARVPDEEFTKAPVTKEKPSAKVDKILKMMDRGTYRVNRHQFLSDIFECGACAISNQFDFPRAEKREKRYVQIMNTYEPEMRQLIAEIFTEIYTLLTQQINPSVGFADYLGELYMKSETSNSKAGQFFTPYDVSKMCAKMSINSVEVEQYIEEDKILTLNEPACGSGGMVLAAVDVLYNEYHFNYSRNLVVYCSDIDSRCVHMAYLQLALAGIPAIIAQQNTLTLEKWDEWRTPAYIMQWLRFRDCLK